MKHAFVTLRQVAVVLLLAVGVVGLGLASPAAAHQGSIQVTGTQCVDADTMEATYTWTWSNVPDNAFDTHVVRKTGTTTIEHNWSGTGGAPLVTVAAHEGEVSWTVTLAKSQFDGTDGPWEYVYSPWKSGYQGARYHDAQVKGFDWSDCAPDTSENKIAFCHANEGNGYNPIETSKAAFYVGHREHVKDIYPAGSYEKGGQSYSWDAQGDQSLLQTGCEQPVVKDAAASVSVTEPTCETAGSASFSTTHATLRAALDQSVGQHTATFDADSGHQFADGSTVKNLDYEIQAALGGQQCAGEKPEPETVTDSDEGCDLDGYGAGVLTRTGEREYVWDDQSDAWVLEPMSDVSWGDWQFTPYTDGEYLEECAPEQPEPKQVSEQHESCDLSQYGEFGAGTIEREGTQAYVWDTEKREWVLGDEVVWGEWEFTPYTDDEYRDECASGQPEAEQVSEQHESCDLSQYGEFGAGTIEREGTQAFVWNAESHAWELGDEVVWGEWEFTPYTDDEYFELCAPPQPPDENREVAGVQASCHIGGQQTYTLTFTTEYVWDAETQEWVPGEETGPVRTEGEFITYTPDQLKSCDKHGSHHQTTEPEVKGVQAHTVPTVVDAGLAAPATPSGTTGSNPLWLLVVGAGVGLIGYAGARRRGEAG